MEPTIEQVKTVKQQYEQKWLKYPAVIAVGIGKLSNGSTGIIVSVASMDARLLQKFPGSIQGVDIEVQETGEIVSF
jgi:hypothetical protein